MKYHTRETLVTRPDFFYMPDQFLLLLDIIMVLILDGSALYAVRMWSKGGNKFSNYCQCTQMP